MKVISFALLVLAAFASADEYPLDIEEPVYRSNVAESSAYRLPEDLDPIHYVIEVTPYFEAEGNHEAFTFDGIVTITVKALKTNITSFVIQENVREISTVSLFTEAGAPVRLNPLNPVERIRQYHFLKVNLAEGVTLVNGANYKLVVEYVGNMNESPLSRGVFRGNYTGDNGKVHWYAATHLQPTNSRQAFPSFDEPGFKSTFDIIINRPASFGESFSNMALNSSTPIANNRVREVFQTTPRMSAYLVTYHISEEFTVIADNNDTQRSFRILARPNARGQGQYALEIGPPLTDWLSNYFGIDYYKMAPNIKNDQIASPYWASGATENWGLVTYRELRLLYQEGETNAVDKMNVATIVAHELAHKWFGNLITCRWWDNVWINEGFASYYQYIAMDGIDKSMELYGLFNILSTHSAMSSDSSASTRALQHTVNSPTEVTGHFSGISYTKGAALLHMLKYLVSESSYKKALNYFLVDRSYEHAFPSDLYSAFARAVREDGIPSSSFDITGFMKTWVEERGFPVLNVEVDRTSGEVSLSQERFFISATATQTNQLWPIPITYTTGNNPNWNNVQPSRVMQGKTDKFQINAGNSWIIFNVKQLAMYRVNYDQNNWQLIANALSTNHNSIDQLNRAQIVDDVFALMRSGRLSYQLGFQVLDFLKKDTSFYVWYPAITGFNWLRNRFLHLPEVLEEFDGYLFEFMDAALKSLGYNVIANEAFTTTLNRFYLMSFACNIGHEGCIKDAEAKFTALVNNNTPVNPNIRRHVFCNGLRAGGRAAFDFLRRRRQNSNNQADQSVMLRALGCTTDEAAGKQFLDMILTPEVQAQDRVNAFTFYYMGDRNNSKVALEWLKQNVNAVRSAVILPSWFNSVLSNIAGYLDEEGLNNMEDWLNANKETIPEFYVGLNAVTSARASQKWGTDNAQMILKAARGSAAIVLPTTMLLFISLITMLLK